MKFVSNQRSQISMTSFRARRAWTKSAMDAATSSELAARILSRRAKLMPL